MIKYDELLENADIMLFKVNFQTPNITVLDFNFYSFDF